MIRRHLILQKFGRHFPLQEKIRKARILHMDQVLGQEPGKGSEAVDKNRRKLHQGCLKRSRPGGSNACVAHAHEVIARAFCDFDVDSGIMPDDRVKKT